MAEEELEHHSAEHVVAGSGLRLAFDLCAVAVVGTLLARHLSKRAERFREEGGSTVCLWVWALFLVPSLMNTMDLFVASPDACTVLLDTIDVALVAAHFAYWVFQLHFLGHLFKNAKLTRHEVKSDHLHAWERALIVAGAIMCAAVPYVLADTAEYHDDQVFHCHHEGDRLPGTALDVFLIIGVVIHIAWAAGIVRTYWKKSGEVLKDVAGSELQQEADRMQVFGFTRRVTMLVVIAQVTQTASVLLAMFGGFYLGKPIFIMVTAVSMALMFRYNDKLYRRMCGCCHGKAYVSFQSLAAQDGVVVDEFASADALGSVYRGVPDEPQPAAV